MDGFVPVALVVVEFGARLLLAGFILLRSRGTPTARLAWLVVLFALPLIGLVAYLLVGETRLGRRRVERHRAIAARIGLSDRSYVSRDPPPRARISRDRIQIAHLAESVGGNVPQPGHELALFGDTDLFIQTLVEDIDRAEDHCHLLFYIFLADHSGRRVADALLRAAERGVACRLLVDAVGSKRFLRSDLRRRLQRGQVRVVEALPASVLRAAFARLDHRNHRKLAVIDGVVGYSGSQNIADAAFAIKPRYAPWVDAMVRLRGPAVRDLQMLFVQDWYLDTDESLEDVLSIRPPHAPDGATVQVIGTGPDSYNEALVQTNLATIHAAREELILTTPYFVPDEATLAGMCTTARRGVDVSLVVPARNDSPFVAAASRSYYERLLDSGVGIHEYQGGLLHAKTLTLDRAFAIISTANLDRRSFELNFEVTLAVYDTDFASELRFLQRSYMHDAVRVALPAWRARGWPKKLWQNALGLLSPLL